MSNSTNIHEPGRRPSGEPGGAGSPSAAVRSDTSVGSTGPLALESLNLRDSEAEYALEYPAVCPACQETIHSIFVVRLLRVRVNFTSTLPRRGRVAVCSHCRTIVSANLTVF